MGLPTSPDCLHAPILPPHPHKSTVSPRAPPSQGQGLSGQRAGPFIVQMGKSSQGGAVSCRGSHSQPAGPSSFCPRPLTWLSSKDKLLKSSCLSWCGLDALQRQALTLEWRPREVYPLAPSLSTPTPATWSFLHFLKLAVCSLWPRRPFCLEGHLPFLFPRKSVSIPQLSVQTVDTASPKERSLFFHFHEARALTPSLGFCPT